MSFLIILVAIKIGLSLCAPHKNDVILSNAINGGGVTSGCPERSVCVPFNLCQDDGIVKDGVGLIEARFDDDDDLPGECFNYDEICCAIFNVTDVKATTTTTKRPAKVAHEMCGIRNMNNVNYKITGDQDSETHFAEFPWMVAILTEEVVDNQIELNIYQCGGSLINPKVVLSAAHCVFGKTAIGFKVRAGEWDTQAKDEIFPHQDRFVADILIHEEFNMNTLYHDVALLITAAAFDLAENVRTVCLPPPVSMNPPTETNCLATGWGKDSYGRNGKYSNILKKVDLPIVSRERCEQSLRDTRLGPYFELHDSFLCAGGEKGRDTCKGDGGSPLVCSIAGDPERYYQVGVVAWGIGCGADNVPAVYASVAADRKWIDEKFFNYNLDSKYYMI